MDTQEVHAQLAAEILKRIAANSAPCNVLKPTTFPAGSLCMHMHRTPRNLEERHACIAEAAYFSAMHRGFSPGHELEDWLTAENEVDARLIRAPRDF
jgi:hypothetical protein